MTITVRDKRERFCDECRKPWRTVYKSLFTMLQRVPERDEIRERLYLRRQGLA